MHTFGLGGLHMGHFRHVKSPEYTYRMVSQRVFACICQSQCCRKSLSDTPWEVLAEMLEAAKRLWAATGERSLGAGHQLMITIYPVPVLCQGISRYIRNRTYAIYVWIISSIQEYKYLFIYVHLFINILYNNQNVPRSGSKPEEGWTL